MAALLGTLNQFDLASRHWKSYVERAELYFTANEINGDEKLCAVFLSSCGDAAYKRIKDVLSPCCPTEVSFKDICALMMTHLQPQPSETVQCFRFNTRSRQAHETVATYVTQPKNVWQRLANSVTRHGYMK